MPAPTFVDHQESVWNTTGASKTVTITVQAGDILVVGCINEDSDETFTVPTNDGTALTWTQRHLLTTASNCEVGIWTAVADSNRTIVITGHVTGSIDNDWGMYARAWRASDGVGAVGSVEGDTTANFSANITTTQANSAIEAAQGDWSAVTGARTALTGAGAWTQKSSYNNPAKYNAITGYHADAGAIGTYAVGSSAPTGQDLSIGLVEIKGTAAAGSLPRSSLIISQAVNRASTY